jgi:hypothetical protein
MRNDVEIMVIISKQGCYFALVDSSRDRGNHLDLDATNKITPDKIDSSIALEPAKVISNDRVRWRSIRSLISLCVTLYFVNF